VRRGGEQFERAATVGVEAVATAAGLGHGVVAAVLGRCLKGYQASGDYSRPCGHALDRAIGKFRGGRRARRCAAAITKRASAVSSARASMDVRRVRHCGKFPKCIRSAVNGG
jgi:hypothetical protein